MTTTLATSSGTPSLCTGTLLAMASPGSDSLISSMSSFDVQVLYLRVSSAKQIAILLQLTSAWEWESFL